MTTLNFEKFYQDYLDLLAAYSLASSTMYVDQNTIAPKKGAFNANKAMSILAGQAFAIQNNPETIRRIREYAETLEEGTPEKQELDLRLRSIAENENVPAEVFTRSVKNRGDSETVWHKAKAENDYASFRPYLEQVMNDTLELAAYIPGYEKGKEYDIMLDQYERGTDQEFYDQFFDTVKKELIPLIRKVRAAKQIDTSRLKSV